MYRMPCQVTAASSGHERAYETSNPPEAEQEVF